MFAQVDSEGCNCQLLQEITDHRKDQLAIPISDRIICSHNDNMVPKKTMQGWDILVQWKDSSCIWIPLKYLKASNPVDLAKYAAGNLLGTLS